MEVEKIPASNEKDAAPTEEPKLNNSSAAEPGEENNVEKAEPVIKPAEDKDDLISKIEEAVKDKPALSQDPEEDISKSSADEFFKKIDEIEKDDKSNGEVVKEVPEEPPHPPAPEPENNKIEEKPSNIEEISSDSVAVVDESGKEESKRTEAMSVDNSEGSSDDVMEVDGDLDNNKPSSEKMDVVEEKPIESIDVDLDESPKPQDVEIKDAQQTENTDVEIKEVSPEANDVEIKEISDDSNDVEIVENTEKEIDVEQKMKELHGEEKTTSTKDVSELSVEEQVKQLESIAHPQKDEEKSSEETNQKDTDEVDANEETTEPAPPSEPEKETDVKEAPVVEETTEEPEKIEPSSEKAEEPTSEKCQEPQEVEQLNGLPEVSNDGESNSDKVEEEKKEEVTEEPHKEEKEVVVEEQPKEEVLSTEVKEDVEESKPAEKAPEPKKTFSLEISCSDNHVNHLQFTSSIPEESIPTENHTFPDLVDACDFIINKFSAIKKAICPEPVVANESTPKNKKGGASKASPVLDTPAKSGKRGNKRSLPDDDEVVSTPKKSKKEPVIEEDHSNKQRVLAKWVDKKYYAGRVVAEKPNNTFAILFEDGALKNLPRKSIVFAETAESDVLPLKGHEIHALVTEDEYECGTVEKVETVKNETVYHVKCETQTVIVTAMQLYLQEDQAKLINKSVEGGEDNTSTPSGRGSRNKRAAEVASPSTPEAGFSGGVTGKRSNKRQKRYS